MRQESQIEKAFIQKLIDLGYAYRPDIRDREALERNFRQKFDALNKVQLSDREFALLLEDITTPDVFAASKILRNKGTLIRDDNTSLDYQLLNLTDWCKNDYEVISQLRMNTHSSHQRYDVLILIGGLPLVQIELKALPISPRKAIEQIVSYKKEACNGYLSSLLAFMQLFVVSNGASTHYFANNRNEHFAFDTREQFLPIYTLSDAQNNHITHLHAFADMQLRKCALGELISKYMVLVEVEQKILVMRPYQIYAVKAIVDCIEQNRGNGYIWHTTGSGKTLTSFKASTLLKDNPYIEKCVFVVDRKDLDRQTRDEFNKFQEGCVEENTNTDTLVRRLLSTDYADKVIVTTIQKLGLALETEAKKQARVLRERAKGNTPVELPNYREKLKPLRNKRIVFIFDECHRSQFGDNHAAIKEFFPKAQLFGFTGTPIFEDNATQYLRTGEEEQFKTTEAVFEKQLHAYTITNAIEDKNVLRFHVDYYKGALVPTSPLRATKEELARIQQEAEQQVDKNAVVKKILEVHRNVTASRRFNALFATASIRDAIEYYRLFKKKQAALQTENPDYEPLHIACIFSPPAGGNRDMQQLQEDLPQEIQDNKEKPELSKTALAEIIADYNAQYGENCCLDNFDEYYSFLQKRIKDQKYVNADFPQHQKIDITIVVDMLLTGFDSKYLNTLYVDKNLRYHSLIQAFSRTNRILNNLKPQGNILDFRAQEGAVKAAIELFSGEEGKQNTRVWLVEPATEVLADFELKVEELRQFIEAQGLTFTPDAPYRLKGVLAQDAFLEKFKAVQKAKTTLDQYTDLSPKQQERIDTLLPPETHEGFKGGYLEIARRRRRERQHDAGSAIEGDSGGTPEGRQLAFDFEYVLFADATIDYDYIMQLVSGMTKTTHQQLTRQQLIALIKGNANFIDEQEMLLAYIDTIDWRYGQDKEAVIAGYEQFKEAQYRTALESIAEKHGLPLSGLSDFVSRVMGRMIFDIEPLNALLKALGYTTMTARRQKREAILQDLIPHLAQRAEGKEISGLNYN